MNMTILWLILGIILFVIEAATVGLICIWFGIAAIITMLSSFIFTNIYIQWFIFIIVSLAMLVICRPMAKNAISSAKETTNASSLIGKTAILSEEINETKAGKVKFGDINWTIVSENGETINKGEKVKVISIKGNKLIVTKI